MTRPIKFRAWDKIDKKMYYDVGLSLIGVQIYEDPKRQPPEVIRLDRGRDCFDIMQFTGLYDKNGKEIYEGDIVLCGTYKSVVEDAMGDYEFYSGAYNKEVIGNIYENKELLK